MKLLLKRILSYIPTPLPVGVTEFNAWADSIIELSGQYADRDSMVQAIANMVIHASPLKGSDSARSHVPKNFFVKGLRKGAANQIASHIFHEIRSKQMAALEAAKAEEVAKQLKAEDSANAEPPANVSNA